MNQEPILIEAETLSLDDVLVDHHYRNCTFTYSNTLIHISDVVFDHCTFEQSDFNQSSFDHVTFKNGSLLNSTFNGSMLFKCQFESMQLLGFTCGNQGHLKEVNFSNSKLTYSNFADTTLTKVAFTNCPMTESSFQHAEVKTSLTFAGCELNGSDFIETNLKGVSLVGASFDQLTLDPTRVRGLIIDHYQAVQLIQQFGIKIGD